MTTVILWSETKIWKEICKLSNVVEISSDQFDTRMAKLFDPMDVLINCISKESWDMSYIYDFNVKWNQRMMNIAKIYWAHYIWISTWRIRDWFSGPYYEDSKSIWDWTEFWNTMCLSENWMEYYNTTIIRWTPTKEIIEYIIKNKIYWKINIPGKYKNWNQNWSLLSNNKLC